MLSTDFSSNCAPNFIQSTVILITLGNMSAENKGFVCTIAYNNIQTMLLYIYNINFTVYIFFELTLSNCMNAH